MIEIISEQQRNLKNIRQIGTPGPQEKIYIEDNAYSRLHQEEYAAKRVFVLMGHTQCQEGNYATFIDAVIPVPKIEFQQLTPLWTNQCWSDIFKEIKRAYEEYIIVGWAMDLRGFSPRVTPDLERVHREQFGGVHQLLLLMDTAEQEECFYVSRGNCLQKKEGFYIYYNASSAQQEDLSRVRVDISHEAPRTSVQNLKTNDYRREQEELEAVPKKKEDKISSYVMVAAVLLLVFVVGAGVYQDKIQLEGLEKTIETMNQKSDSTEGGVVEIIQPGSELTELSETETETETVWIEQEEEIPIEEIPEESEQGEGDEAPVTSIMAKTYLVQKGDTLIGICQKLYGSADKLTEIARLNNINETNCIYEGQILVLPE